jgi:ABC-type transporter Mla maintaining outer membrane lipid asymmetry ATPase subunit MlaF
VFLHEGRVAARGTAAELERSADPLVRAFMQARGHSG